MGMKDLNLLRWMSQVSGDSVGDVIAELTNTLMADGKTPANRGACWESNAGELQVTLPKATADVLTDHYYDTHRLTRGGVIEILLGNLAAPRESPEDECWMGTVKWHGYEQRVKCMAPSAMLVRHRHRANARLRHRAATASGSDLEEINEALDTLTGQRAAAVVQDMAGDTVLAGISLSRRMRVLANQHRIEPTPHKSDKVDLFGWEEPAAAQVPKGDAAVKPVWDDALGWHVPSTHTRVVHKQHGLWGGDYVGSIGD